jgi:hypothetical protein
MKRNLGGYKFVGLLVLFFLICIGFVFSDDTKTEIVPGTTYTLSQLGITIDFTFDGKELKCEVYIDGTEIYNEIEIKHESQRLFISFWRIRKENWGNSKANSLHMYKLDPDSVLTSYSSGINDIIFNEYRKDNVELRNARNIAKLIEVLYEDTICKILL